VEERNSASGACKQVGQVSPGGAGTDHNRIVCRHTGFLWSRMPEARQTVCPAHSQAAMQWKPSVGCRDYWLSTHDRVRTYHVGTVGFACTVWLWNRHIQDSRMARQAFDVRREGGCGRLAAMGPSARPQPMKPTRHRLTATLSATRTIL